MLNKASKPAQAIRLGLLFGKKIQKLANLMGVKKKSMSENMDFFV